MNRLAVYFPTVLLLLGLALPTVGPLVDHHFADRQPGHNHLFAVSSHLHAIDSLHDHLYGGTEGSTGYSETPTLYNYESGLAASADTLRGATDLLSAAQYEPTSVFMLPAPFVATLIGQSVPPSARPPEPLA